MFMEVCARLSNSNHLEWMIVIGDGPGKSLCRSECPQRSPLHLVIHVKWCEWYTLVESFLLKMSIVPY